MVLRKNLGIAVLLAGAFSGMAPTANATPGYAAGFATACAICDGAIVSAFSVVNTAIISSEQVLMESIGMGVGGQTGAVGFPMLQVTIESAEAQQTKQVVTALELATKQIAAEVRALPVIQRELERQHTVGEFAPNQREERKQQIKAGTAFNMGGNSSLSAGLSFLRGERAVIGSDLSANQRASSTISNSGGNSSSPSISDSQALGRVASNVKNSTRIAQSQVLKKARTAAEDEGASLYELLGGNLLISDEYTTIKEDSQENDNLDLLAQLSSADLPSTADAVQQIATTSAEVNRVVDDKISRMSMSIPMVIQDRYIRMRRAHETALGGAEYMLSAIGEQVDGPISDEGFLRMMGTRRPRDQYWLAIVANDARFAAQELAQMEAEHLYIKYQKYLAKRDLNLALSQVVSKLLQRERP